MALKRIKCVVTGPARSSKSSMLLNLTTGQTADNDKEYTPTVFDNYAGLVSGGLKSGQSFPGGFLRRTRTGK